MTITVETLADRLQGEIRGNPGFVVRGAESIDRADSDQITFVLDEKNLRKLSSSQAGAVIIGRALSDSLTGPALSRTLILVDDPQAAFIQVLEQLRPSRPRTNVGISSAATVSPTARIGANTNVHPGAFIGDEVVVGGNCDIFPGAFIGPGCKLGDEVLIHPNVVLYQGVRIGHRVTIHASAVLGADGFGYRLVDGRHQKIPHFGTVEVRDDVEIGACTTIDRGMIGATVIGEGTKLDNLVMVAHNCELGRHNVFVSQVGLAGSVTTGDYVVCAGQVGIADHVHLGDGCVLGSKAGVHKDMPGGNTYLGAPALPAPEAIKAEMAQRKLPEMRKQVRRLEAQLAELTEKLEALSAGGRGNRLAG